MAEIKKRSVSKFNDELKLNGFKVFEIKKDSKAVKVYSRKDFYKICLTTGQSRIHYADRSYTHNGTILFFGNPHIPYSWETLSRTYVGYTCLFSEEFLNLSSHSQSILESPLFQLDGSPVLSIDKNQRNFLNGIFQRMIDEQNSDYEHKDDIIRNYIHLIIHEAKKMQPSKVEHNAKNAASRLSAVFLELLERQFPIENPDQPLRMRSAKDFAQQLSVHVNYLNRSLKKTTGKSTSTHISERIGGEAKALLQHTNWNISEVAYSLGFEYPTYFNNFFKKQTGRSPKEHRTQVV